MYDTSFDDVHLHPSIVLVFSDDSEMLYGQISDSEFAYESMIGH